MKTSFLIFSFAVLFIYEATSQQVQWICTFNNEGNNSQLSKTWIGSGGDIYVNTIQVNPFSQGSYTNLVHVSPEGEMKSIISQNFISEFGILVPMADGHYMSDGRQEDPDKKNRKRFRLFDTDGKTLSQSKPFEGKIYGRLQNKDEYAWIISSSGGFGIHHFLIKHISNDFDIRTDSVSLEPIRLDSMGITEQYMDPVMLKNQSVSIPGLYGFLGGSEHTIGPKNGVVFNIRGTQVIWKYPSELSPDRLEAIAADGDFTWALFASPKRVRHLVKINVKGKPVMIRDIHMPYAISNFIILDKKILLIHGSSLYVYSIRCKLLGEYSLGDYGISDLRDIIAVSKDSFILTGKTLQKIAVVKMKLI